MRNIGTCILVKQYFQISACPIGVYKQQTNKNLQTTCIRPHVAGRQLTITTFGMQIEGVIQTAAPQNYFDQTLSLQAKAPKDFGSVMMTVGVPGLLLAGTLVSWLVVTHGQILRFFAHRDKPIDLLSSAPCQIMQRSVQGYQLSCR